jgi:hypothetical protein
VTKTSSSFGIDNISKKEVKKSSGEHKAPRKEPKRTKQSDSESEKSEPLPETVLARLELKGTGTINIKDKTDFEIAKAMWNALMIKLGIKEEKDS